MTTRLLSKRSREEKVRPSHRWFPRGAALASCLLMNLARRCRRSRRFAPLALVAATVATSALGTRAAMAEPVIGADLQAGAFLSRDGSAPAVDGAATVGYAIRGAQWFLVPEGRVGYLKVGDAYGRHLLRFGAGARLGWFGRVSPSLHLHAGYGRAEGRDGDAVVSRGGPTFEAAGAVDIAISRHLALGPRVGAGVMLASTGSGSELTPWFVGGVEFVVSLGDSPEIPVARTARKQ